MIQLAISQNRIEAVVIGAFVLDDYRQFEDAVRYRRKFEGRVDVLFDLRDMLSYSLDVAWEELRYSRAHGEDFGRIAVLASDEWVKWSVWINRAFMDAEIVLFDDDTEARAWLMQRDERAQAA
jgi:hypothetical protein